MEIKEIEKITKKMNEHEKEDEFSLVKNVENKNEIDLQDNKMKDPLKNYIMDNRRLVYHRLEGKEPSDDLDSERDNHIALRVSKGRRKSNTNIGTNIVLFKKYVLGSKGNVILFILTVTGMAITWCGWAYTNNNFYSIKTYVICFIPYFLTNYYMFLSFLTEPGIIPRECPQFSRKDLEQNEEQKNENSEVIPKIFRERICVTCNIIRPPGTSHCRECDNCVQNFDHHCFFISNCVGKRNHKYFYLFLFFGTIGSLIMVILGSRTIYNVFIINADKTIYVYYNNDKKLFLICASFLALFLLCPLFGLRFCYCNGVFALISFGIYFHLWYKYLYIQKNLPIYFHPMLLAFYAASVFFFFFVLMTFFGQTCYVSSGYTIKQTFSIKEEIIQINSSKTNNKIKEEYIRAKTCKERFNNIIRLITSDIGESLIVPERDLVQKT